MNNIKVEDFYKKDYEDFLRKVIQKKDISFTERMELFKYYKDKKLTKERYSLLLKNEALEQLLSEQSETLTDERKNSLLHQLKNAQNRQRLLTEIFDDDVIKKYVSEVLSDKERINLAEARIASEIPAEGKIESDTLL